MKRDNKRAMASKKLNHKNHLAREAIKNERSDGKIGLLGTIKRR